MKVDKLRELTIEELNQQLASLKTELFNLRFQMAVGQLENPMRVREVRRSIAQVKTILREREIRHEA